MALFVLATACGRSEILPMGATDFGTAGMESPGGRAGSGGMMSAGTGGTSGRGGSAGTTATRGGSAGKSNGGRAGAGEGGKAGAFGGAGSGGMSGFAGSPAGSGGVTQQCGDGVVQGKEECDDGNDDDTDDCLRSCILPTCGDGVIWKGHETCDEGVPELGDGCSDSCRLEVEEVVAGDASTCAMSHGVVKCWGRGTAGQLGLGDAETRGDGPGEMGEALPPVALGKDVLAVRLSGGASHFCALLSGTDQRLKCWGYNGDGELGLEDTEWRGDGPGEIGDELPAVELGSYISVQNFSAGYNSTCAVYETAHSPDTWLLKCWGANQAGQLGQGDTSYRGDEPGEMAAALLPVDLGTNVHPELVSVGKSHTCSVIADGTLRCWGDNQYGKLGLGDTVARGDGSGEMGTSLPAVDVGPAWTNALIAAGADHTCATQQLSDGRLVLKCWGRNDDGQLGLEDLNGRGDAPGEMGAALPYVNLGTDRQPWQLGIGAHHTCARLDDSTIKCWGKNDHGQLGYGDTRSRGGQPGDMGDGLPTVELGQPAIAVSAAGDHTCALLEDRTVRCWGDNAHGELGLGDIEARGDEPGEMGENLPPVDVGF